MSRLTIIVEPRMAALAQPKEAEVTEPAPAALAEPAGMPDLADDRANLSAPLDPRFTFENFIVGKPNELAHAAARRIAEACVSPVHTVPFNPLFLYGGGGPGQTPFFQSPPPPVPPNAPPAPAVYLSAAKIINHCLPPLPLPPPM